MRAIHLALLIAGCGDNARPVPDAAALDLAEALKCCDTQYIEGLRACAADRVTIENVCFDLPCAGGPEGINGDVRVCNVKGDTAYGCCLTADGRDASDGEVQVCAAEFLPPGMCGPLECGTGIIQWRTIQVCGG